MISVFFNEAGYYVAGETIETARACSPATHPDGKQVHASTHHLYAILILALQELISVSKIEDIIVYNDSRLIEEINGITTCIDEESSVFADFIRRELIPRIAGIVLLRKKSAKYVGEKITEAHARMILSVNKELRDKKFRELSDKIEAASHNEKRAALERLRNNWFGEQTNDNRSE